MEDSLVYKKISVKSNLRNYDVIFSNIEDAVKPLKDNNNTVFIVDQNVWEIYSKNKLSQLNENDVIVLEIGEDKKNLNSVQIVYDQLISKNPKKNLTIVTIGGGIAQDITGFVASTLYRGVGWIFIPTTLLAQADSCIGSKTSLNYKIFKNLLGTFYPPNRVIIDIHFIETLTEYDYYSGVGEIAKLHLMGGKEKADFYFNHINEIKTRDISVLENLISNSLFVKKSYMEDDEFDTGKRNLLNYGHCFGHAIETATDFEVPHGQAVVAGMILANDVANSKGLLEQKIHDEINSKLNEILLKKERIKEINPDLIIEGMKKDKKRIASGLPLVMLCNAFSLVKITDLTETEASNTMKKFIKNL